MIICNMEISRYSKDIQDKINFMCMRDQNKQELMIHMNAYLFAPNDQYQLSDW